MKKAALKATRGNCLNSGVFWKPTENETLIAKVVGIKKTKYGSALSVRVLDMVTGAEEPQLKIVPLSATLEGVDEILIPNEYYGFTFNGMVDIPDTDENKGFRYKDISVFEVGIEDISETE
jgi:hypothetical protein